jgi:magnesium-transporting ATPase (P-type)
MAREKVIVKHLAAIQNFGSVDVLWSDKTGTLTGGDMALDRSLSDGVGYADVCDWVWNVDALVLFYDPTKRANVPGQEKDDQ